MRPRLSLKKERLAELLADDLVQVVGANAITYKCPSLQGCTTAWTCGCPLTYGCPTNGCG